MKSFFRFIFFILIIVLIILGIRYFMPGFYTQQSNRAHGVYFIYQGDQALKKHKWQNAIDLYKKGLALYPEHYSAWHNLGSIYVLYEDYNSALDAYAHAIKYNPNYICARMNYGIVSAEKFGDFDSAITQYDEIIKMKKKMLNIPWIFDNTKSTKVNKGYAFYNKGLAYKNKSFYCEKDEYLLRIKYLKEALEAYKSAIKVLKKNYEAQYNLALAYHMLGYKRDAGLNYCKAIRISPLSYEAHYNLAILLRSLRQYKESREELEKAAELVSFADGFSNRQNYIFEVLADVSSTMKELNEDDQPVLDKAMIRKIAEHRYTVETEAMLLDNFSTCKSFKIFDKNFEDTENDINFRRSINIPE